MLAHPVVAPGELLVIVVAEAQATSLLLLHLSKAFDLAALHGNGAWRGRLGAWRCQQG